MLCFIPNVEPVNASLKKAEEETPKGPRQRKKPKWLQTFETGNQYDSITKLNLETMEDTSVTFHRRVLHSFVDILFCY